MTVNFQFANSIAISKAVIFGLNLRIQTGGVFHCECPALLGVLLIVWPVVGRGLINCMAERRR